MFLIGANLMCCLIFNTKVSFVLTKSQYISLHPCGCTAHCELLIDYLLIILIISKI
jgi:hypothetical protein